MDHAGAPQTPGNFQDTHKILKAGKEPNVMPDDKETDNSRDEKTSLCPSRFTPPPSEQFP